MSVPVLDLDWPVPLKWRRGGESRLCGIDVFYDFDWLDVFPDERTQFKNGLCLAKAVQDNCPEGKTPALLLTRREDVRQGYWPTATFLACVVNIEEYRSTDGDAAHSYLARHLTIDLTDIEQLQELASTADPATLRAFIESHVDVEHIKAWATANAQNLEQLRDFAGSDSSQHLAEPEQVIAALSSLGELDAEATEALTAFLRASSPERRLDLLRSFTDDSGGRYVTGEVFAERTSQRVDDARQAIDAYEALLADDKTTETKMQKFISENVWLLGLDYASMQPQQAGPSGKMDFLLKRFDGFYDLLELKSPSDELIRAPAISDDAAAPPPHEYALSKALAQALAQAMVYRDRLTRYSDMADEIFGLPHARDPRLIVIIGKADSLPVHRQRVLLELNKSLHRAEVVPYDILAKRARAILANVEHYLLEAEKVVEVTDQPAD